MRRRKKIATAAMMSVTPIDMEIIAAVFGLCFGARDRTQIVSTVAGTDPAARSPATRQSTLPLLEWMAVPAVFVVAANSRSVPTAVSGWTPKSSISNGVIREPPPIPVRPTRAPTTKPESG